MERHALYHAITIVKSPVAGYVIQPFIVKDNGVEAIRDKPTRLADFDEFAIDDNLLSDLATARVNPACTLRSTQHSYAGDPDATQLLSQSDENGSQLHPNVLETERKSFDFVSNSDSENENSLFFWDAVTEE